MDDKTNHMHESKLAYHSAIGQWTTDERGADRCVQLAQAAAAIALAEATQVQAAILDAQMSKPQFVRIGSERVDISRIERIRELEHKQDRGPDFSIYIYLSSGQVALLHDADADTFLAWWNKNTDVVRLDVPEEAK